MDSMQPERAAFEQTHDRNMEHRWGRRRPCRARVSITARGIDGRGQLRNVSTSGAFLETSVRLPLFAQLALTLLREDGSQHVLEFAAVVVRHDGDGVGIEWCDPIPGSICRAFGCATECAYPKCEPA